MVVGREEDMENRIGLHANYFRGTQLEWDMCSIAEFLIEQGGTAMELMPDHLFRLSRGEFCRFRDLTQANNIELIVGAGRSPQTDASSPDPEIREAAYRRAAELIRLLGEAGCHKWDGLVHACWPGRPQGILTDGVKREYTERSVEGMRRILPLLEEAEIDVYLEVVNRFEHFIFNTVEEGVNFCREVGSRRVRLLIDTYHMNIEEHSICDAIRQCADSGCLGHFHVGEANRSIPGTVPSHMDWDGIFGTLRDVRYEGAYILEPVIKNGCQFAANTALWRDLSGGAGIAEMKRKAAAGLEFVRAHCKSRIEVEN